MIKYINGDLFSHVFNPAHKYYVPHVVNNVGLMGSGFAYGVNKHWPHVKYSYTELHDSNGLTLGHNQNVFVAPNVICVNMIAQRAPGGYKISNRYFRPIVLEALEECMYRVREDIESDKLNYCEIVAPKFGSLRAGGDWDNEIVPMIEKVWDKIPVTIYEYKE